MADRVISICTQAHSGEWLKNCHVANENEVRKGCVQNQKPVYRI